MMNFDISPKFFRPAGLLMSACVCLSFGSLFIPTKLADPAVVVPHPSIPVEAAKAGATEDWYAGVMKQIEADVLKPRSVSPGRIRLENPRHNFRGEFSLAGLSLSQAPVSSKLQDRPVMAVAPTATPLPSPTPVESGPWAFEWRTESYGRMGQTRPLQAVPPKTKAGRVEYAYRGLTEWYLNTAGGLEQGFTLSDRPQGKGEMRIVSRPLGGLKPRLNSDGSSIALVNSAGAETLHYSKLKVSDANGLVLQSRLLVQQDRIVLAFNDQGASYPVTVDPVIGAASAWTQGLGALAGDVFATCVAPAGDVNGDGYSDVLVSAYGSNSYQGRVYLYLGSPAGLGASATWTQAVGTAIGDRYGFSAASAGDVNGDGYSDVIVGAYGAAGGTYQGKVYLYLGSASGLTGAAAWTATGEAVGDRFGFCVASAGDVNGDGYGDVIVGAPGYTSYQGKAYLYLGSSTGLGAAATWTQGVGAPATVEDFGISVAGAGDVNGDGYGDVIVGTLNNRASLFLGSATGLGAAATWTQGVGSAPADEFGSCVAGAGDVNGDGYADVIVGAPGYTSSQGMAKLFLGSATGLGAGFSYLGEATGNRFGTSVAPAGDVNGDGYGDVIVGASGYNSNQGKAYLYLGYPSGLSGPVAWTQGIGENAGDRFGSTVASAGDVNGDGLGDVIVGAYLYSAGAANRGKAYLFLGSVENPGAALPWTAQGAAASDSFGSCVASAGDFNGDGYGDAVVGVPYNNSGRGMVYLYQGSATALNPGSTWNQAFGEASNNYFGYSAASAGDVNGDGYGDLIVGAYGNSSDQGKAYLYLGSAAGLQSVVSWPQGVGEAASDRFGISVAAAGDVNGDGYGDVIVGASQYSVGAAQRGKAYVYLGSATGLGAAAPWPQGLGEAAGNYFGLSVAPAGDVNGDGYGDVIVGAKGYNGWRGKAYLYLGSPTGLSASAAWGGSVGENAADYFGVCVASAGDVNGDGYGDVIVGAEGYNSNQGKAYLFLGSATGLGAASAWPQAVGEAIGDKFGHTVASAGDVNNDGYGDVIVSSYGNNGSQGKTYLFLGSAFGLGSAIAWPQGAGLAASELYGYSVASAGDVNGDGFGDLLVGSPGYSVGLFGRGKAYLYLGNQSTGIRRTTQVLNAAASAPVAQGGTASFAIANSQFNLSTFKASPTGRTRAHLRVEVQPMGQAFDGNGVYYGLWQDTSPTAATVVSINGGLSPQTAYHWRARWFYEPAKAAYGWLHSAWFGPQAASLSGHYAVRTGPIVTASQTSTPTPTLTSTKTVTRTRTISPTLTRTPTITPSWTISPTASPTPTISQTFTFSPTVTQTSTVGPEGLGNTALAPVPVRPGQPLCAYFAEAPIRCRVDLYNLAGEKAAGADLGGENGPCMDTSHLAPGVYIARVTSEYSSGARSLWQKVAVIR